MTRPDDHREPEQRRLVRALRDYVNESQLYVSHGGHDLNMHPTDLAGLSVVGGWEPDQGPLTPTQLGRELHLTPPAVSAMLNRLERAGHIARRANQQDRRSTEIVLGERGLEVVIAAFAALGEAMDRLMQTYDHEQLSEVANFVEAATRATRGARTDEVPPVSPDT